MEKSQLTFFEQIKFSGRHRSQQAPDFAEWGCIVCIIVVTKMQGTPFTAYPALYLCIFQHCLLAFCSNTTASLPPKTA